MKKTIFIYVLKKKQKLAKLNVRKTKSFYFPISNKMVLQAAS